MSVVLPAVLSGAVLFTPSLLRRKPSFIHAPIALCIGYAAGYSGIAGLPSIPPIDAAGWTVYIPIIAAAISIAITFFNFKERYYYLFAGLMSFGISVLLLKPLLQYAWNAAEGALWMSGTGIFILLIWLLLNKSADISGSLPALSAALVLSAFSGITLLLSGSILLGQLSGVLAASLVPVAFLSLLAPDLALYRMATPVIVPVLAGLWVIGYFFAEMPLMSTAFLFIAACSTFICKLRWVGGLSPLKRSFITGAAAAVPSAIALAIAAFFYF